MPLLQGKGRRRPVHNRSEDVKTEEVVHFDEMLLSPDLKTAIDAEGYEHPSPIQLKAIPLGRLGVDLIGQAKSGTGKTLVFTIIALEKVRLNDDREGAAFAVPPPQAIIIAPTREIAVQIHHVIEQLSQHFSGPKPRSAVFIGGLPIASDESLLRGGLHIVVGTPGRIRALISSKALEVDDVSVVILDEADKLMDDSMGVQVDAILDALPANRQTLAFSATFPEQLMQRLEKEFMKDPQFIVLSNDAPSLEGVKQYYIEVPSNPKRFERFESKVSSLLQLLSTLAFRQCIVFCNDHATSDSLTTRLCDEGWPAMFIAGSQQQTQRMEAMEALRTFSIRVLVSTDLTARGVDVERINLVVNLDVPRDGETYLHRIGRSGRFGRRGLSISLVTPAELDALRRMIRLYRTDVCPLPANFSVRSLATGDDEVENEEDAERLKELERCRAAAKIKRKEERRARKQTKAAKKTQQPSSASVAVQHPWQQHQWQSQWSAAPPNYYRSGPWKEMSSPLPSQPTPFQYCVPVFYCCQAVTPTPYYYSYCYCCCPYTCPSTQALAPVPTQSMHASARRSPSASQTNGEWMPYPPIPPSTHSKQAISTSRGKKGPQKKQNRKASNK